MGTAREAEAARAADLLGEARSLLERALGVLDKAEGAGNLRDAISALGEARHTVALLARMAPQTATPAGAETKVIYISVKEKRTAAVETAPDDDIEDSWSGLEPAGTDEGPETPAEPETVPAPEPDPAAAARAAERERRRQRLMLGKSG